MEIVLQWLEYMFAAFSPTITGWASGIKSTVLELVYEDPAASSPKMSLFAGIVATVAGVAGATALVFGTFFWLKNMATFKSGAPR